MSLFKEVFGTDWSDSQFKTRETQVQSSYGHGENEWLWYFPNIIISKHTVMYIQKGKDGMAYVVLNDHSEPEKRTMINTGANFDTLDLG